MTALCPFVEFGIFQLLDPRTLLFGMLLVYDVLIFLMMRYVVFTIDRVVPLYSCFLISELFRIECLAVILCVLRNLNSL